MNRLTENDGSGNWQLKGVSWQQLYIGQPLTKEVQERLYGALFKLMEYENSGLTPDEVQKLAEKEKNVIFGGRLAQYKYYDMDKCIASSLAFSEKELG